MKRRAASADRYNGKHLYVAVQPAVDGLVEVEAGVLVDESSRERSGLVRGIVPCGRYVSWLEDSNRSWAEVRSDLADWLAEHHEHSLGPIYFELLDRDPARGCNRLAVHCRTLGGAGDGRFELPGAKEAYCVARDWPLLEGSMPRTRAPVSSPRSSPSE